MDSESLITKRLHVSGLTPSLSPTDLSQRLSTFGAVKFLDGFGLLDGVGKPRKFGYVTIETTAPKLARCEFFIYFIGLRLMGACRFELIERLNVEGGEVKDWRSKT